MSDPQRFPKVSIQCSPVVLMGLVFLLMGIVALVVTR